MKSGSSWPGRRLGQGEPLIRVSEDCGFQDYSTFSRAYKKRFGASPNTPISKHQDLVPATPSGLKRHERDDCIRPLPGGPAQNCRLHHAGGSHWGHLISRRPVAPVRGAAGLPHICLFLGEGFRLHTAGGSTFLRLVLFALLSELPFNQMVYGRWIAPSGQNVLWALALGLCAIGCVQRAPSEPGLHSLFWYSAAAGCCLLGQLPHTDYGAFGVLLCLLFHGTQGLPGRFWICGEFFS